MKLSKEDHKTIFKCVKTARKAAFEKCATEAGFTPGEGQRPTKEERVIIKSCMKAQGFKHFHKGHHKFNKENQASESSETLKPVSNQ